MLYCCKSVWQSLFSISNMLKIKKTEKGFGAVEIICLVLTLCIISILSYGSYKNIQRRSEANHQAAKGTAKPQPQDTAADTYNPYITNQAHKTQLEAVQKQLNQASDLSATLAILQKQLAPYNLVIGSSSTSSAIIKPISNDDNKLVKSFGLFFLDEIARYPTDFFQTVGIKNINLANGSIAANNGQTESNGLEDLANATVFYNVQGSVGGPQDTRKTMEHEIGHFTSNYVGLRPSASLSGWQEWTALNPPDFSYALSCRTLHPVASIKLQPGFVSLYAMTCPAEDWAETYATAIDDSLSSYSQDPYRAKKVDFIKSKILSKQSNWSSIFGPQ
jgi:Tfp pilus assembly protein PilE